MIAVMWISLKTLQGAAKVQPTSQEQIALQTGSCEFLLNDSKSHCALYIGCIPILKAWPSGILSQVWASQGSCKVRLELNQQQLVLSWEVTITWQEKLLHPRRTEMNKPLFLWFESPCQRSDSLVSLHYSSSLTERLACSLFPDNIQILTLYWPGIVICSKAFKAPQESDWA